MLGSLYKMHVEKSEELKTTFHDKNYDYCIWRSRVTTMCWEKSGSLKQLRGFLFAFVWPSVGEHHSFSKYFLKKLKRLYSFHFPYCFLFLTFFISFLCFFIFVVFLCFWVLLCISSFFPSPLTFCGCFLFLFAFVLSK